MSVVRTTPEADAQALDVDRWWQGHRPAAPELFVRELRGAFDLLARAPAVGRRYRRTRVPGLRRILLPESRHHVYYVFDDDSDTVVVLAIWSAVRGRGPRLHSGGR
jgi:plasmid stabilization system protein ParE